MSKKIFIVNHIDKFINHFAVYAETAAEAEEFVNKNESNYEFEPFTSRHLGGKVTFVNDVTEDVYLNVFDKHNEYLLNLTKEQKLNFIGGNEPYTEVCKPCHTESPFWVAGVVYKDISK